MAGARIGELLRRGAPVLAALLLLVALHLLMAERLAGEFAVVGVSTTELSPELSRVLAYYLLFGLTAVGLLAWGLWRLAPRAADRFLAALGQGEDRAFGIATALLAFALALGVHQVLLQRTPITDDENAYRLAAQILGEGKLYLPSDPDRDFFHHTFVVNDGKVYTQYFLGWPALLMPALKAGCEGLANPFFFALTVPAIFLILRRLAGSTWARVGVLLMLSSPMLTLSAGTLLAHTSCMAALAWCFYCGLRCREGGSARYWHAALAATFCLAFFNRPLTALGLGLPILLAWLWERRASPARWREIAAFALPAALGAALFLYVDRALTGHALLSPYASYVAFASEGKGQEDLHEMAFRSWSYSISNQLSSLFRLNFAAFAWPCSWLFAGLAGAGAYRRVLLATVPSFLAANFFTNHIGIDLYAPMHLIEIGLPMVLLTTLGLERLCRAGAELDAALAEGGRRYGLAALPLLVAGASVAVGLLFYLPYQAHTMWAAARLERASRAGLDQLPQPALIFVKQPYALRDCAGTGLIHWVRQAPITHPAFDSEVLWASHINVTADRAFAAHRFPERHAFVASWNLETCERRFTPLAEATEQDFPPDGFGIYR